MIRAAAAGLALGLGAAAAADTAPPFLRIGIAGAQPGLPAIEAQRADIVSVERARGHGGRDGLTLRLAPGFDDAMARMTQDRDGQEVVIHLCGVEFLRATLRGAIPSALFTLSLEDRATRRRVEAALASGGCEDFPSG